MKAFKTFKAYEFLNKSVVKVYPSAYKDYYLRPATLYVGIKDTALLRAYLTNLPEGYTLHTIDHKAYLSRAVDNELINPLSLRYMTGSTSGGAYNVLLGINDIAIGTDGGGSVLAPALATNLCGFISGLLPVLKQEKYSTDQIKFTPSAGLIAKDLVYINDFVTKVLDLELSTETIPDYYLLEDSSVNSKNRGELIELLNELLLHHDYVVYKEQDIDCYEYADSLHGIYDNHQAQLMGNKGLIRVVNMVSATAICVPSKKLASGYLIICKSEVMKLSGLFAIAKAFNISRPEMVDRYFEDTKIDKL